jgi:hypothetical protein
MATDQGGGRVEFSTPEAVPEKGTFPYSVTLKNETGAALPAAAVSAVTATLVAATGGAAVFTARDVRNTNGGTLTDGAFAYVLSAADLALQADEADLTFAERRLTLQFTATGSGGQALPIIREVLFFLRNLRDVS